MDSFKLCIVLSLAGICLGSGGAVSSSGGGLGSITETEDTRLLREGSPLELTCYHNETDITTTWMKNGLDLIDGQNIKIFKNSTLYIKSANKDDIGLYSCQGTDKEPREIHVIELVVHKELAKTTTVLENDKLALSCQVEGNPQPTVQWLKDGELLEESVNSTSLTFAVNEYNVTNANLLIKPVLKSHTGKYVCLISQYSIQVNTTTDVQVKDIYAALWPFLGIVAEVIILCIIIFIYEKRRIKANFDDSDSDPVQEQKCLSDNKEGEIRQRK